MGRQYKVVIKPFFEHISYSSLSERRLDKIVLGLGLGIGKNDRLQAEEMKRPQWIAYRPFTLRISLDTLKLERVLSYSIIVQAECLAT